MLITSKALCCGSCCHQQHLGGSQNLLLWLLLQPEISLLTNFIAVEIFLTSKYCCCCFFQKEIALGTGQSTSFIGVAALATRDSLTVVAISSHQR